MGSTMSVQRTLGDGLYGFEEAVRWLRFFRQGDVNLEMRLRASHGEALDLKARATCLGQQPTGALGGGCIAAIHGNVAGVGDRVCGPFHRQPTERLAAGPTRDIECLEFEVRHPAQHTADDQDVAASARAAEHPHPGHVASFEKNDQGCAGERGAACAYGHFNSCRTQPARGGPFAEYTQARLHPAHCLSAPLNIPGRSGGEPGHDHDCGDSDEFRHDGPDDSTPFIAKWRQILREVLYGMTTYEFVQQAREMRASMQRLFLVGVFGDMLGVPLLPSYYGLRLLPWIVPEIEAWKREVLRERELGTNHEHHLHGL
jgi:hypothetical protein